MIGGFIALAIAAIGAAYAGLVVRAAPNRRDNVAFGALAAVDAAMTGWRGLNVIAGDTIIDSAVALPCSMMLIALGVITIEFITPFPRRAAMRWRWRIPLLAWAVVTVALMVFENRYRQDSTIPHQITAWSYFAPMTLLVFALGARAYRLTNDRPARLVIAMVWFRWGFGFLAFMFAPAMGILEEAVWAETTIATLVSFVVIGTLVLRTDLFSMRSSTAEAITLATIALIVVLTGGAAVWAIQRWTGPGTLQQALLVGATLVPLAVAGVSRVLYPRVERSVLAGFDERRARRLGVQGDPLPTEAAAAIEEATRRISSIGDGAAVRWLVASALPAQLAEDLRDGEPRRRDPSPSGRFTSRPDLPALVPGRPPPDFIVPALGVDRALVGAFAIDGGLIDRDTYLVARELAARIALVVERTEAVSALEDARRLAALGQFAAAIAHDIRTPLTSISMNVQILRRKLELSDDDREHLDIALEELGHLDRSVAEILDFAKPVRLVSEAIDVGELIETAASTLSPVLSERNIALRTAVATPEAANAAPLTVHGDPQRLRQVLVNLVGNAADASKPGAHVILRATADNGNVAIEVEDHGRGIASADLLRIFEPFFTTRPDGTGLGLAICHKVIRAHGGDIHVRSTVGEGSTFTVVLPAA